MYVELLFWKSARDCEDVRDEYGWKVMRSCATTSCTPFIQQACIMFRTLDTQAASSVRSTLRMLAPQSALHAQARAQKDQAPTEGPASGGESEHDGAALRAQQQPGQQPRKKLRAAATFSAEMQDELRELFERHGNQKGCVDVIAAELGGGAYKRSQIQRQIKEMGLRRGQLTDNQVP